MATLRKTIDSPGRNVQIRVRRAESEEQNATVHNTGEMRNLGIRNRDNEWRGLCAGCRRISFDKRFIVVRNKHAQEEDAQDVEEQDPVECELNGPRDGLARILCLSHSDTDKLRAKVGKHRIDKRAPEAVEFSCGLVALLNVRSKCSRTLPVFESCRRSRTSSNSKEEGQEDNANDDYNFNGTEPELKFAKESNTEVVDGDNCDQEYSDENSRIHFVWWTPILDNQSGRGQLVWRGDDIFAPIGPTKSKSKSRVAEPRSVARETRCVRKPCCHFSKCTHDDPDEETNESVGDED